MNPSCYVKAYRSIDTYRKKRKLLGLVEEYQALKYSKVLWVKIYFMLHSLVTFCLLNGNLIGVRKLFGLQDGFLKTKMDLSLITENTPKSNKYLWDTYLRLDILSLTFIYRRYSYNIYDIRDFGMKYCWTTLSLGWKLMMSLGQNEPFYTYNHQHTRNLKSEACCGARVWANIQLFWRKSWIKHTRN